MKILVCGAGVAGLATTAHLQRDGHDVTLLEGAPEIRTAGGPVDIRGDALDFIREMGLFEQVKAAEVRLTAAMEFVDDDGERIAAFPIEHASDSPEDIEIQRHDLLPILADALRDGTDLRFSTSIRCLTDHGDRVQVVFTDGSADDYDLVVGADGVHSVTRRLAFGPESDYVRFLGVYIGLAPIGPSAPAGTPSRTHTAPGRMIAIIQAGDVELAGLYFRSDLLEMDYRDRTSVREILVRTYTDTLWRDQGLIGRVVDSPGLYFDECAQTHMTAWGRGRVVLVGDAAHCASPLSGRGTSLAISGGRFLVKALAEHGDDLDAAFARYHGLQRPYVEAGQASVERAIALLVPETAAQIAQRNTLLKERELHQT